MFFLCLLTLFRHNISKYSFHLFKHVSFTSPDLTSSTMPPDVRLTLPHMTIEVRWIPLDIPPEARLNSPGNSIFSRLNYKNMTHEARLIFAVISREDRFTTEKMSRNAPFTSRQDSRGSIYFCRYVSRGSFLQT